MTQSQFDNAGRSISVTSGVGTAAVSTTQTFYDADGNVAATLNPLGYETDFVYDARNHKVQELEPAVQDYSVALPNSKRPTSELEIRSSRAG